MVEIKTLKISQNSVQLSNPKSLLNPKLVVTLPHGIDPKTPYPLPPFVSYPCTSQILINLFPITSLVPPPPSISSLHMSRVSYDLISTPPSISSPFWVKFSSPCVGRVSLDSIPTHLFNFSLAHECPIGMAIPKMKLQCTNVVQVWQFPT